MKIFHLPKIAIVYFQTLQIFICVKLREQYGQQNARRFRKATQSGLLSNNESEKCSGFKWKSWLIMYD